MPRGGLGMLSVKGCWLSMPITQEPNADGWRQSRDMEAFRTDTSFVDGYTTARQHAATESTTLLVRFGRRVHLLSRTPAADHLTK